MTAGEFSRVGVVGLGLIGGSLALRLHAAGRPVVGSDPDAATREAAAATGLEVHAEPGPWLSGCDLVVVCAPLDAMDVVLARVAEHVDEAATVIDVGSVKRPVHQAARAAGLGHRFVGAHPMAGTERTGFEHADPALLEGATWAVTLEPGDPAGLDRAARVARFLATDLAATVCVLPPEVHDETAAVISHVPHVLAHLLLVGAEESGHPELAGIMAAGSFRDGTRVAGTNPARTRNMLLGNSRAVEAELSRLRSRLDQLSAVLAEGDDTSLSHWLDAAAEKATTVRQPQPAGLAADRVDADTIARLLQEPGARVVVADPGQGPGR